MSKMNRAGIYTVYLYVFTNYEDETTLNHRL